MNFSFQAANRNSDIKTELSIVNLLEKKQMIIV